MSEPTPLKRKRVSKGRVRLWAWTAGALSFLNPLILLSHFPKPPQDGTSSTPATSSQPSARPVVVIVTRKIVYDSASSSVSSSGSGPIHYVYAPAASAPVATSCGTHPC